MMPRIVSKIAMATSPITSTSSVLSVRCTSTLSITTWKNSGETRAKSWRKNEASRTSPSRWRYLWIAPRWRKQYGNEILAAVISEAEALAVSEPVAWITAALKTRIGETDGSRITRPHAGSATSNEAAFLASMARGAIKVLEKSNPPRSSGATSRVISPAVEANAQSKPKAGDRKSYRGTGQF